MVILKRIYFLSLGQTNFHKPNHISDTEGVTKRTLSFSITAGEIKCINFQEKRMREKCGMVQMQIEVWPEKSRRKRSGS